MKTENRVWGVAAFLIALSIFMLCAPAWATKPKPPKQPPVAVNAKLSSHQLQALENTSLAKSSTGPVTLDSSLVGGDTSATGGSTGDWVNVSEHTFYSYAQSDRPAVGCFKSGDAAGGNDGKFGALGFYWLDGNCWADHLASQERDVEINARLKCSARKYRNAIAYDVKGTRARQDACVNMVKSSGLAKISQERAAMQAEIDKLGEQKGTLLELREHDKEVCNESKDRIAEACRK